MGLGPGAVAGIRSAPAMRAVQTYATTILDADGELGVELHAIPGALAGEVVVDLPEGGGAGAQPPRPIASTAVLGELLRDLLSAPVQRVPGPDEVWDSGATNAWLGAFRPPAGDLAAFVDHVIAADVVPIAAPAVQTTSLAALVGGGDATATVAVIAGRPTMLLRAADAIVVVRPAHSVQGEGPADLRITLGGRARSPFGIS